MVVPFCTESNLVANDDCPSIKPVSLIREEERSFMHGDVAIEDAMYTYRDVNIHYYEEIPESPPFYKYTLAEGETTGYYNYQPGAIVNGMCRIHGAPSLPTPTVPEDDEENGEEQDLSGFEVNDGGYDNTLD